MKGKQQRGVVFTATGKAHYHALATQAAASLKFHNPDLPVDLFSDQMISDPVFDAVEVDEAATRHTKIDALLNSRFERTLYLDSDTMILACIRDVFDVLDRFDIALAHDQFWANGYCAITYRRSFPAAFPHFNGGVIAIRRSAETNTFLLDWRQAIKDHGIDRDQPSLRELLWESDLRIATLPPEYNVMNTRLVRSKPLNNAHAAPRILHNPHFYQFYDQFKDSPDPVADALGPWNAGRLQTLLMTDRTLWPDKTKDGNASRVERARRWFSNLAWVIPRLPRFFKFSISYQSRRVWHFLSKQLSKKSFSEQPPKITKG